MGACEFYSVGSGKTVAEAFSTLREDALYYNGHGGYTGTIAEKQDYKSASAQVFDSRKSAEEFAYTKLSDDDHWCQDKWGPAAYVQFKNDKGEMKYLFFGYASE